MKRFLMMTAIVGLFALAAGKAWADRSWTTTWVSPDGSTSSASATFYDPVSSDGLVGRYDFRGGRFFGQMKNGGQEFEGYWVEDSGSTSCGKGNTIEGSNYYGRVRFKADGANSFSGFWSYCDDEPAYGWSGVARWDVGDRVLGQWSDDSWYPARIGEVRDDRYALQFDDGDTGEAGYQQVLPFSWRPGSRVECLWQGKKKYYPGTISEMSGNDLYILYDDGDKENTKTALCRDLGN